jgi:glucokinase
LALRQRGRRTATKIVQNADFSSLEDALLAFLDEHGARSQVRRAAVAVACPILGDRVELTNSEWGFSQSELRTVLGAERLHVVNDFEAQARSVPRLTPERTETLRAGLPRPASPRALLGPGTGLGVASLVPCAGGWQAISGEGGHRDLAPTTSEEWAVVEALAARFGHVSAERVLSGPGLVNLYSVLADSEADLRPRDVVARALAGDDQAATRAVGLFSGWLGAVAGDLALTVGALGGVFLSGGMLPKMGAAFDRDLFCRRFDAKGRLCAYLEPIPLEMIVDPLCALLGLEEILDEPKGG